MVSMPPRHGKSLLAATIFPAWFLGRHPGAQVVTATYAESLALYHSRQARRIVAEPTYARIFPGVQGARDDKTAAAEWQTSAGGSYYAVGVGGSLTGRGMDLGILDDTIRDRATANSERYRRAILDWYRSTFYTRLAPGGRIVVIQTRWHPQDLPGTLLAEAADGEPWTVLDFPAVDDAGAALWPDRWPRERLAAIEQAVGKYEWACLYQGRPTVRGGNILRVVTDGGPADTIRFHDRLEDFPAIPYRRVWDVASSAKQRAKDDPDWTWGTLGAVQHVTDPTTRQQIPHLWIRDCAYCREEAPKRNALIQRVAEQDGPSVEIVVETFGAYKDAAATLEQILRGRRMIRRITLPGDKLVKVSPAEPIFEAGNVHLFRAPWNAEWIRQHADFTGLDGAGHDDAVDTTGILVQLSRAPRAGIAHPGMMTA